MFYTLGCWLKNFQMASVALSAVDGGSSFKKQFARLVGVLRVRSQRA